ncbi:MAG: sigma-70 family RNA polymerase sigma factor [Victivallaceae bacterium]|nr:sigma-70 family RNA polymerase sigma factor [Victivallaceae bacterium]
MSFTTNKTLLERIHDNDDVSWTEFYETYTPLIRLRGRDFSLNEEELRELAQDVMFAIFKSSERFVYDPAKGKFRNYLKTVTAHCVGAILRRRKNAAVYCEEDNVPDESDVLEASWNSEWNAHLVEEALRMLREKMEPLSYQAFIFYAIEGKSAVAVARSLDISVNAVYLAKSRGVAYLRECLHQIRSGED